MIQKNSFRYLIGLVLAIALSVVSIQVLYTSVFENSFVVSDCALDKFDSGSNTESAHSSVCCTVCLTLPQFNLLSDIEILSIVKSSLVFHQLVGRTEAPEPFPPKHIYLI